MPKPAVPTQKLPLYLILLASGMIWGSTFSLARIATEAGAHPIGLSFWQAAGGGCFLLLFCLLSGKRIGNKKWLNRSFLLPAIVVGFAGSVVPGTLLFYAAPHVPTGVLAITIALVPLLTYAMSWMMGLDNFSAIRLSGVLLGFVAIVIIMLPGSDLPGTGTQRWIFIALLASVFYMFENIYVDRFVPPDTDVTVLLMAGLFSAAIMLAPLVLLSKTFVEISLPLEKADIAILSMMVVSSVAYLMYLYLIQTAGAVFASMSGYVITIAGVFWGMVIFSEQHSGWIWTSLVMMLIGMALVTPREKQDTL